MSTIQLSELQPAKTEFKELSNQQCSDIVGGRKGGKGREIRNNITTNIRNEVTNNIFNQLNINVNNTVIVAVNVRELGIDIDNKVTQGNQIGG
ncbi:MAG: hypothetical protein Tsb0014_15390 [Pleurocapsa sp.]